jgi:hypothetical protein
MVMVMVMQKPVAAADECGVSGRSAVADYHCQDADERHHHHHHHYPLLPLATTDGTSIATDVNYGWWLTPMIPLMMMMLLMMIVGVVERQVAVPGGSAEAVESDCY